MTCQYGFDLRQAPGNSPGRLPDLSSIGPLLLFGDTSAILQVSSEWPGSLIVADLGDQTARERILGREVNLL
jgi:hypothetical protein